MTSVHRVGADVRIDWAADAGRGAHSHPDIGEAEPLAPLEMLGKALCVNATGAAA
ncbi:hypothetical protein ACQI5H_20225 [Mycobacterium heidelbergense]|uniref:hypothetical protein n=1 Tax=Mycobacterium heidelbergense TaxID=53376 RepID=UPI003CF33C00